MNHTLLTYTKQLIVSSDGYCSRPITIAGDLTIGFGRNLSSTGISLSEANVLFIHDIMACEAQLIANIPDTYSPLSNPRKAVLLDLCFHLGISTLLAQAQTLSFIRANDFERAANAMLASAWAKRAPLRALKLSEIMRRDRPIDEATSCPFKTSNPQNPTTLQPQNPNQRS